jgi:tetratricopeptide (TPR) repeat protein
MPGGYYIIEDTYMHFGPSAAAHLGDTKISFGDYFSELALSKIRQWIEGDGASKDFKNYWFSSTESISFAKSIIAIHKKPAVLSAKEAIAIVDQYCATEAGASPDALFGAAGVILAHDGLPERAEALMRKAIAEKPEAPEFHNRISEIFSRQGRFAAAIASLSRATQLGPQDPFYWDRLARLYARIGDHERASDSMKKALELFPNPHCYHFLSETLRNQGLIGEAVHALTQAVELARKTPMADIWEGELQSLTAQERSVRASDAALT